MTVITAEPQSTKITRRDRAYFDFVEGLKAFEYGINAQTMQDLVESRAPDALTGPPEAAAEKVNAALRNIPLIQSKWRIRRTTQEMNWNRSYEVVHRHEEQLLRELEEAERRGPGTLEWDPNFKYPKYYVERDLSSCDIHIQPGGFDRDPLGGFVYVWGTRVFRRGTNNDFDEQKRLAKTIPGPEDGQVRRVVEFGCALGAGTTTLKERFPDAEVWGIDPSAPFIRFAHWRATKLGSEVHFAQRLAEDSKFPDNHFDIVYAYILYHEVPVEIGQQIVREAHRILRPGGVYVVVDFTSVKTDPSPVNLYTRIMDSAHNGEPYATKWVLSDFTGFASTLFRSVDDHEQPRPGLQIRVCRK